MRKRCLADTLGNRDYLYLGSARFLLESNANHVLCSFVTLLHHSEKVNEPRRQSSALPWRSRCVERCEQVHTFLQRPSVTQRRSSSTCGRRRSSCSDVSEAQGIRRSCSQMNTPFRRRQGSAGERSRAGTVLFRTWRNVFWRQCGVWTALLPWVLHRGR